MNKRAMMLPLVGLGTAATAAVLTWTAYAQDKSEKPMTLDQAPAAVKAAVLKESAGAPITEFETEKDNGAVVYEAEWTAGGIQREAAFLEDGTLVESEETIPAEKAPAAVRAAIEKHFGAGAKVTVEKKMVVVYELEAKVDGKEKEVLVSPTGRVQKEEEDDDKDEDEKDED